MPPPVSPATSSAIVASPPSLPPPTATRRQLLRLASRATAASFLALLPTGGDSNGGATAARAAEEVFDPVTEAERAASAAVSERVGEAVRLLEQGRSLQARGAFAEALAPFTAVAREYGELALAAYARVGRALVLYEVGDRDESIAEMEEASVALRGYPEIHAALAAALYADKHAPLLAENQFAIATLLDPHYTDLAYVRDTKHWPPSLVTSLQHFITLS